ncbi:hypothetical protein glysoja_037877 [Glycine soja]|uniref:DUF7870 domain-containing protein n=1 Tax=Glycine soja TaxID=3848 RepID=A0A0B2QTP8_GLYSO|nr:hypothetical protein glysoja_037877 [Glycine soja]
MCCVVRGHLIERFCTRVTPIILSSYLLRSWGFCSFSSLPLAVPRFTASGFDSAIEEQEFDDLHGMLFMFSNKFTRLSNVEVHRDPGEHVEVKGRGMGRIQPLQSSGRGEFDGEVEKIQGFDFANWLKKTVSKNDFVVMKMDVEGTEFDLIPRLIKTGAICLIDDIFLECHYNRWQRCCPGQRSAKYEKTYDPCLQLFKSLRQSGVLVHQWF